MAKVKISEFDVNPDNNTDINSINIAEGCAPSGINNAIRQLMSDLKAFQTGADGDSFNGAVGAITPSTGAFTSLSASGAFSANGGTTLGDASGDALTINSSAVSIPNGLNFDSNTLVIDATNNRVGVGTASPATLLHISSATGSATPTATELRIATTTSASDWSTTSPWGRLGFYSADSSLSAKTQVALDATADSTTGGSSSLIFSLSDQSTGTLTERMRITSFGSVGIGQASPAARLDLKQASDNWYSGIKLERSAATTQYGFVSSAQGTTYVSAVDTAAAGNNVIVFGNSTDGTTLTERMRITSAGNVGIGTSSPLSKVDVVGSGSFDGVMRVRSTGTNTPSVALGVDAIASAAGYVGTLNNLAFQIRTNDTERMRIDTNGNLLVGTTNNTINGNVGSGFTSSNSSGGSGVLFVYNSASSSADSAPCMSLQKAMTTTTSSARFIQFYANGTGTPMGGIVGNGSSNVQFATLSDSREKANIQSISGSLDKINALNPVEFDWIADGSHVNAGFVAQEVEQVFPEFVVDNMSNDGQESRKGLTGGMTGGIVAHLVKAIQEQQAIINDLKARIETLESK
jgi:hypothetical protein